MPTAYEGKEPYIFVSYAHLDKKEVMGYISALESQGFRVWFDGGIEAGSEWPEYIANRLADSACVMAFISKNFVASKNCRQELALSQELEKEQLNVYLEQVELPLGMRMQLGLNQAIWRENFDTDQAFLEELCKARLIADCRERIPGASQNPQPQKPVTKTERKPERKNYSPQEEKLIKKCKVLGWCGTLLELLYIPLSVELMSTMSYLEVSGFWMFVNMLFPHTVIALINKIMFSIHRKKLQKAGLDLEPLKNASISVLLTLLFATLMSVAVGTFNLYYSTSIFLLMFIALGLNIAPFIIAGLITLFMAD
ncbi:MAG: toll/interleukin-1 receptor domain-containing protein [Oscillospiraceae bacterium]|nr:toll/interleukin-1 receptor domain-containing protein [Oscillospiraceae bacterium]